MNARPSKIICVGRSYAEHAKELGNAIPDRPVLFIKPPSSLIGLQDGIEWNPANGSCHFECELTLRIDQPLKNETDPEKAVQNEIDECANSEEFIVESDGYSEEPIPAAEPVETEIPSFMSQEEM